MGAVSKCSDAAVVTACCITRRWSGPRRRYTSLAVERRACAAAAAQRHYVRPPDQSPMSATHMQTKSLKLVLQTIEEARAEVEAMSPADRAHVSADWLARLG